MSYDYQNNKLKLLFSEILHSYSLCESVDFGRLFLKHFNSFDSAAIDLDGKLLYEEAVSKGIITNKEKEKLLIDENEWSEVKDSEIRGLFLFIDNLQKTKAKLHLPSQIDQINKEIREGEEKLGKLQQEKNSKMGFTAENYVQKKINENYVFNSFFKDESLSTRRFNKDEFNDLEDTQVTGLISIYNQFAEQFNAVNLKKIALSPFFLNIFYLCDDDPYVFYGKPVVFLSFYQIEVFSYGRMFKNIISENREIITDDLMSDPDKLIDFVNANKNTKELLEKQGKQDIGGGGVIFGANQEDVKKLGINSGVGISPSKLVGKKMSEIIEAHGYK